MNCTGAQIIVKLLERQGTTHMAGIPGGATLPLYDALARSSITHILARHEQGAGFIGHGMARATGRPAVCTATSGPGATNLVTAVADAMSDSVPLIAITGQVGTPLLGTDAFQEVDTYGLTVPITRHNFLVRHPAELLEVIPEAFRIAGSARPGPVVIDVPKDVQTATIPVDAWPEPVSPAPPAPCDAGDIDRVATLIRRASRPVILAGGGLANADAAAELRALADTCDIPVAATLRGLGIIPNDHPLFLGMLGMHGSFAANLAVEEADLVVACGCRFNDRTTGRADDFCSRAHIVHLDIDRAELDKIKPADLSLTGDIRRALADMATLTGRQDHATWRSRIEEIRCKHPDPLPGGDLRDPVDLICRTASLARPHTIITTDVGQHQMWTAQHWPFQDPRTFLTSAGLGTMGFGLPAAIGAALACPQQPVLCISGDGSLLMNIQELATLAELNLDVKVLVLDNASLGLVRQQQQLFYGGRITASRFASHPDLAAVARGFGVPACNLGLSDDPIALLTEVLQTTGPCLIEAPIHPEANVYPMVPPGACNREMIEGIRHD